MQTVNLHQREDNCFAFVEFHERTHAVGQPVPCLGGVTATE